MKKSCIFLSVLAVSVLLFAGCTKESGETAFVQPVGQLTGYGPVGLSERFSGIVTNRGETEIKADSQKTIKEILVKEGDEVSEGDVLFTYDMELAELNLEKAELELQQMQGTVDQKTREKAELEKEKEKAKQEDKLSYTLEIQSCETEIREANYNIALKEKEVERLRESLEVVEFTAPLDGRIGELNENGGSDPYSGESLPFMKIIEAGTYRIKGYINENNLGALMEGTPILIRSRMDDSTWTGYVSMIDWENPSTGNNSNNYYLEETVGEAEMSSPSKYPFYIELDDAEGLLLGQHVYIEPDLGGSSEVEEGLEMPLWYFIDYTDTEGTIWADNGKGKLEKRTVTISNVDETMGTATVTDGLSVRDLIAMPDESLKEGMDCEEMSSFQEFDPMVPMEDDFYGEEGMIAE